MRRVLALPSLVLALAVALAAGAPLAAAEDPIFVGWTDALPGLTGPYDPTSTNPCKAGQESCVHNVIKEMTKRFDGLAATCDHDAVFSLTYLRTTEEYHRFWHEGRFADPAFLNHYDAVFAKYYFDAYDNWQKGDTSAVPQAWRIAFDAADKQKVSGSGNLFLGMSAHINRDLPYVIEEIGLYAPDGTSRKPDHDTVNQFLNRISDSLFPELARRFDPTIDDANVPGTTADDLLTFQIVPSWRENAWRNAERLASATTAAERALVVASIEQEAAQIANQLVTATAYGPLSSQTAAQRNTYCGLHHNDV